MNDAKMLKVSPLKLLLFVSFCLLLLISESDQCGPGCQQKTSSCSSYDPNKKKKENDPELEEPPPVPKCKKCGDFKVNHYNTEPTQKDMRVAKITTQDKVDSKGCAIKEFVCHKGEAKALLLTWFKKNGDPAGTKSANNHGKVVGKIFCNQEGKWTKKKDRNLLDGVTCTEIGAK